MQWKKKCNENKKKYAMKKNMQWNLLQSPNISIKSSRKERSHEFSKEGSRKGYNLTRKFHANFVATPTSTHQKKKPEMSGMGENL